MNKTGMLPQGFLLPNGTKRGRVLAEAEHWQIFMTSAECYALVVDTHLHALWVNDGLIGDGLFVLVAFGDSTFFVFISEKDYIISSVQHGPYPETSIEAYAFAVALRESRKVNGNVSLHDALYLEQFSLLLPTYTCTDTFDDPTVLGTWLSSGVRIPATSNRLCGLMTWMSRQEVQSIVKDAGFICDSDKPQEKLNGNFSLPGRPELEAFFREHIIDIIQNEDKYLSMGISFPSAVVLYGPPGCGKTFAVDRLTEFLEWPRYDIDSGSIGSPYIHDTSRKTSDIFEEAIRNAPSVVVIDEMEAFLSDRMTENAGLHRVEEVAEFLRHIPEASKNRVLVIAMTNMIDAIDPAVLRRGRFDHIIEVKMPSAEEVEALLSSLFANLPLSSDVSLSKLASQLDGHPLSDAAFVVKEAGRLAAREGKDVIDMKSVLAAYESLSRKEDKRRKVGF